MAQYLDEAAITGQAPEGAKGTLAAGGMHVLDEATITGQAPREPTFMENIGGFLHDPDSWKHMGKSLAGAAAQASDLATSFVTGIANIPGQTGAIIGSTLGGATTKEALTEALKHQLLPDAVAHPWAKVASELGAEAEKAYQENPIGWVLGQLDSAIKGTGDFAEKAQGIPTEAVQLLASQTMSLLGFKAAKGGLAKTYWDSRVEQLPAIVPKTEAPAAEPVRQPSTYERVAPEAKTLTPEEAIAASKERVKDIKAAVKAETPEEKATRMATTILPEGEAAWGDQTVHVTGEPVKGGDGKMYTPVTHQGTATFVLTEELKPAEAKAQVGLPEPLAAPAEVAKSQGPGEFPKTRLTEGKTLEELNRPPNTLETALDKVRTGRGFDLTAEEVFSLNRVARAGGKIVNAEGKPIGPAVNQAGRVDPRLLAALGLASAGVAIAMSPDGMDKLANLGLIGATIGVGKAGVESALGTLKKETGPYRWNTIEALPENKTLFSKQEVLDAAKKWPSEHKVLERVVGSVGGAKISAKDLMAGLVEGSAGWKLTPKETGRYADYGLERIRPDERSVDHTTGQPILKGTHGPDTATTTLYELPEHMQMSDANHFNNDRLFGWTRSFVEDGVRHVVEIQSDLAQHAKALKPSEIDKVYEDVKALMTLRDAYIDVLGDTTKSITQEKLNSFLDVVKKVSPDQEMFIADAMHGTEAQLREKGASWPAMLTDVLVHRSKQINLRLHEANAKLASGAIDSRLSPILKNWPRQLIRHELQKADAAGEGQVRFATADTVAKVEGWPTNEGTQPRILKDGSMEALPRFKDLGHQFIYNRYAGEVTRYLRGLGGKEYTDAKGYTWIDVPTKGAVDTKGRITQVGNANPKLLAAVAAAGGVAAYLTANPEDVGKVAMLGALGTLAAKGKSLAHIVEGDLISKARTGDQTAFKEIYDRTAPYVRRNVASYERSGVNIDDVLQRTYTSFAEALKKDPNLPGGFRGDAQAKTWLVRAATNRAKSEVLYQKSRPETVSLETEIGDEGHTIQDTLGHSDTPQKARAMQDLQGKLAAAMDKLDPVFKEAFELRELEGKTYEEIAELQGVPIGTVRSRISRARESLQHSMREYKNLEAGKADVKTLAITAATAGGAALGAYMAEPDHKLIGALKGAGYGIGAAVVGANFKPKALVDIIKAAQDSAPMIRINDLVGQMTSQTKYAKVAARQLAVSIVKRVPDAARRTAIYEYLEGERGTKLSAAETAVANEVRQYLDGIGNAAKDAGVIGNLIHDYVTRIYHSPLAATSGRVVVGEGTTATPFGKNRGYKTRAEAEAAGYTLVTSDIARVVEMYSDSANRAIGGKQLVNTLRLLKADDHALVEKTKSAPDNYVFIEHPGLRGFKVHPDIAPDLKFVFDQANLGSIVAGLEAINNTQKRLGVSLSLFHATALEHALLGGMSILKSPAVGVKAFGQSFLPTVFGESVVMKMLDSGGLHDTVKRAIDSGLEFSIDRIKPMIEEENPGAMYSVAAKTSQFLDNTIPGAGKYTVGAMLKLNHMFDNAMWGRFHATLKMQTFLDKASELSRNNAREVSAGRSPLLAATEIDKAAASFTNDLYGGLNYYKIGAEMESRWARELTMQTFSPTGRLAMRMVLFAPDWTISTTRAFVKGFGPRALVGAAGGVVGSQLDTDTSLSKIVGGVLVGTAAMVGGQMAGLKGAHGSGIRGALPEELGGRAANLVDLHRQYFLRSAFIYSTIIDALNVQYSGHHFWENKDPTRLDLGDGRTVQASKHFMEPMHWLVDPKKQAMGKGSFLVKEGMSQLTDSEYWSPKGAPRMGSTPRDQDVSLPTRIGHAARQFAPISAQGFTQGNPQSALGGMLGVGIYGKTREEKARAKAELVALHNTPAYKALQAERKRKKARGE